MNKGASAVALAATVTALIAAGCGDDDDSSEATAAASTTKAEWIDEANRICRESNTAMEAEAEEFFADAKGVPEGEADVAFQAEVLVPGISEQVRAVAALPRPAGDEEEIAAIVDAAEAGLAQAHEDPAIIEENGGSLAEASRLLAEYGVDGCA